MMNATKRARMEASSAKQKQVVTLAMSFSAPSLYHWIIICAGGDKIEFWPSAWKWRHENKTERKTIDELIEFLAQSAKEHKAKQANGQIPKKPESPVRCDYCGELAEMVTGADVYPHRPDLKSVLIYRCIPCEARVGCHPGTETPLGRLANASLREWKQKTHAAFDPLWKGKDKDRRSVMYAWLAEKLEIEQEHCHIGMFDKAMCERAIHICFRWSGRKTGANS